MHERERTADRRLLTLRRDSFSGYGLAEWPLQRLGWRTWCELST